MLFRGQGAKRSKVVLFIPSNDIIIRVIKTTQGISPKIFKEDHNHLPSCLVEGPKTDLKRLAIPAKAPTHSRQYLGTEFFHEVFRYY